jgi:hypothetical protein
METGEEQERWRWLRKMKRGVFFRTNFEDVERASGGKVL